MSQEAFAPIVLPAGWDAQKDCEHFEERWDPDPTYAKGLWRMMRFHFGYFATTLDASLYYFGRKDATLVHVEPRCLSTAEKIEILQEVARTSELVAHYRDRLIEDLRHCEISENERQRVLREYRLARDGAWLYPVIEVIDYLGDAGTYLLETMDAENGDFQRIADERFEEPEDEYH